MLSNVAAVVGERVSAFELGVVSEVFGLDRTDDGLPGYDFALCAVRPGLIPTTSAYEDHSTRALERRALADLVAVPWCTDSRVQPPAELAEALDAAVDRGRRLLA